VWTPCSACPPEDDVQRLAGFLNEGEKIAILAGAGALHARAELLALAEALGAPIVKTLSGKAAVPDDSPYTTGGIGLLGTRPSEDLMSDIDTLLLVGTNFPYTKHLPPPGKVRVAQIEADQVRAGTRVATELPVVGDSKQTLQALLPLIKQRDESPFLAKYQNAMGKWRQEMARLLSADRDPAPRRRSRRDRPGARSRRPGHRGRERQPGRAAAAREGRVRAGQEVRPGFPEGPTAQDHDRDHAVQ
jgi:pyruvate dehydrogenase (quinone)